MQYFHSLKVGAKFLVEKYCLDTLHKYKLIESGIIPNTPLEITQKNFSFPIIKYQGSKFVLAESTAQKFMGYQP